MVVLHVMTGRLVREWLTAIAEGRDCCHRRCRRTIIVIVSGHFGGRIELIVIDRDSVVVIVGLVEVSSVDSLAAARLALLLLQMVVMVMVTAAVVVIIIDQVLGMRMMMAVMEVIVVVRMMIRMMGCRRVMMLIMIVRVIVLVVILANRIRLGHIHFRRSIRLNQVRIAGAVVIRLLVVIVVKVRGRRHLITVTITGIVNVKLGRLNMAMELHLLGAGTAGGMLERWCSRRLYGRHRIQVVGLQLTVMMAELDLVLAVVVVHHHLGRPLGRVVIVQHVILWGRLMVLLLLLL